MYECSNWMTWAFWELFDYCLRINFCFVSLCLGGLCVQCGSSWTENLGKHKFMVNLWKFKESFIILDNWNWNNCNRQYWIGKMHFWRIIIVRSKSQRLPNVIVWISIFVFSFSKIYCCECGYTGNNISMYVWLCHDCVCVCARTLVCCVFFFHSSYF